MGGLISLIKLFILLFVIHKYNVLNIVPIKIQLYINVSVE